MNTADLHETEICALCSHSVSNHSLKDAEKAFCCHGCHAVYQILSSKNQLANFQENPIFKQAVQSGLISNPTLLEQIRKNQPDMPSQELQRLYIEIGEMWCPACSELIRLIMLQQKGIKNCVVDYATDLASIEFSPRYISKDEIFALIKKMGYTVIPLDSEHHKTVSFSLYLRFAIAAFCALNVMMFAYPLYATYFNFDNQGYGKLFAWLSFYSSIPVVTYCAWPILRRFLTGCQVGIYGMETLVVIGVSTAMALSLNDLLQGGTKVYFDSMTVIITFMLLGKIIEARAKFSAKDSIFRLNRALPRRGRKRFADGTVNFVSIKDIHPGDIVVATTGEKIILDGIVMEGEGSCDESVMTGESMPVKKEMGSKVIGGAILQHGVIAFRVIASAEQSTLQRILDSVQQEIGNKTAYVRSADKIVQWFVPTVLSIAFGAALGCWVFNVADPGKSVLETALIRAVSILLISCPCSIGIAAPLVESHVMNAMANLGAIVRNRGCLAFLGKETIYLFDKTGTITVGQFVVLSGLEKVPHNILKGLKTLANHSSHPIARAIAAAIKEEHADVAKIEEIAGKGLKGILQGRLLLLGSRAFLIENAISVPENGVMNDCMASESYVAFDGKYIAVISLGDQIRSDVTKMLSGLSAKSILISGDSYNTVEAVSNKCVFDAFKAQCTPSQKKDFVDDLRSQGHVVAMLGDGINDAPALTAANIGISVISASDISIQVSDILLTTERLEILPKILHLAKRGRKIINQNLFWAFIFNVVGIGLAALGWLSPIFAASAMVSSSLMVIFNAKRVHKL